MIPLSRRTLTIAVGGAAAILALILFSAAREPANPLPSSYRFVCVATGEFFDLSAQEAGMIPARNPKTGKYTLVVCARAEDGAWHVIDDNRGIVEDQLQSENKWVDPQTLVIRAPR